jgi:hypothetical protein
MQKAICGIDYLSGFPTTTRYGLRASWPTGLAYTLWIEQGELRKLSDEVYEAIKDTTLRYQYDPYGGDRSRRIEWDIPQGTKISRFKSKDFPADYGRDIRADDLPYYP